MTSANGIDHGAVEAARHGITRSPEWPRVEKAHLSRQPHCVCCKPRTNTASGLQVHHIFPFHYCIALGRPDLELDDRNLITLCEDETGKPGENHHLLVGHLDDFASSNLAVTRDAQQTFFGLTKEQIEANAEWLREKGARIKPLDKMSPEDKKSFADLMNKQFPQK